MRMIFGLFDDEEREVKEELITEVKKEIVVKDSNGKEVKPGTECVFLVGGKIMTGIFTGVVKGGMWNFAGKGKYMEFSYSVHPKSIVSLYIVE